MSESEKRSERVLFAFSDTSFNFEILVSANGGIRLRRNNVYNKKHRWELVGNTMPLPRWLKIQNSFFG